MARIIRLTPGYLRTFRRLGLARARSALAGVAQSLSRDELPGSGDFGAIIPPQLRVWVRRVPGFNLWVSYSFEESEVRILTVTALPPVPADD